MSKSKNEFMKTAATVLIVWASSSRAQPAYHALIELMPLCDLASLATTKPAALES